MEMTGEQRIAAPRQRVWDALNDPAVLKACLRGCEHLEKVSENGFEARVNAKVGPVKAAFSGAATLSELDPPRSYRITGEGKGGAMGFAKGGARVRLEEDGDSGATRLIYTVEAKLGGKLAQMGGRLVDAAAREIADDFFLRFAEAVGQPVEVAAEVAAARLPAWAWALGTIAIVLVLVLLFAL